LKKEKIDKKKKKRGKNERQEKYDTNSREKKRCRNKIRKFSKEKKGTLY